MSVSLQARYVFPIDRPPIEHGVVTLEDERIVAVGPRAANQPVRDLGNVALIPGLINAHTHLEFSHLPSPLGRPGQTLPEWIRLVIAERGRGRNTAIESIAAGLRESLAGGVTAIGDIATTPRDAYALENMPRVAAFVEVIGFSRARAESAFADLEQRLVIARAPGGGLLGISPHAPYTVSLPLLERLIAFARLQKLPVAMHLAESREELEFLDRAAGPFQELLEERSMWDALAAPNNMRPLDYLRRLAEAPRALVIHGNYLRNDEHTLLADNARHMCLVYCPRTHAYFQHPPYPLAELLSRGVRVVLGTDSRASNPDLNLLSEIQLVVRHQPGVAPQRILQMATLDAAAALGWESERGSIAAGQIADLVSLRLPEDVAPGADAALEAAFSDSSEAVAVWLRGQEIPATR